MLGVVILDADALVLNAVHEREALRTVDDLCREVDELLRVALEVIEPAAVHEDAVNATPRELGFVLEVCQDVGQLDVVNRPGFSGDCFS